MIALWLLFFTSVFWFILFRYRRRHLYKLSNLFPKSESELPVIGIAHTLSGSMEDVLVTMQKLSNEAMQVGGIVRVWIGPLLYFFAVDPVDAETVLTTCLEKDYMYQFLKPIMGNGTITAPVSIWGRRRKILNRALNPRIIAILLENFCKNSEKLAKLLDSRTDLRKVIMWPFMTRYSFDSGFESVSDMTSNAQENLDSSMFEAFDRMQEIICERFFHLWLHPDWLFRLFPLSSEFNKNMAMTNKYADKVVKSVRDEMKTKEECKTITGPGQGSKTMKLGALMLSLSGEDEEGYTDVELRDEFITIAIAATDTTAASIGFTLKLLGKYPEIQEKVYQELRDVFGDSDRTIVKEDFKKLNYLDRVVNESLRLFPPVPFIARKVHKDTKLPSGLVLPAGSSVCVSIWGAHRDPKYWGPDADNFDPDRFLPERLNLAHACSYMPFSFGRRNCVVYLYGLLPVKALVSTIIRRYKVVGEKETSPAPQIRANFAIVMKAVDEFQLELEKRK